MSRARFNSKTTSKLRAPEDGIVVSGRGSGWILDRWHTALAKLATSHGGRLSRGRNIARNGRVRGLWLAPGLASAQVISEQAFNVSLRVRVFSDAEWKRVLDRMLGDLRLLGAFLDGRLSHSFTDDLEGEGIRLVPDANELDGDCDCDDYMRPCAHMVATHHVLAEAVDGEPCSCSRSADAHAPNGLPRFNARGATTALPMSFPTTNPRPLARIGSPPPSNFPKPTSASNLPNISVPDSVHWAHHLEKSIFFRR